MNTTDKSRDPFAGETPLAALARSCRFSDCSHINETGCRVIQAMAYGYLAPERLGSYHTMKRDLARLAQGQHKSANRVEKERRKGLSLLSWKMKKAWP